MDDNEDTFTPYAIIPRQSQGFQTDLGPVNASGYVDPQNRNLGGRLEYSNQDVIAGINKDLMNPASVDVSMGNIMANLDKYGYDVNTSLGPLPGQVGYNSRNKTPYYNYNNGPLNLEVTPKDIQAGVNVGNFTASGTYSKEAGPAVNANYRKMFENGMIDVNGNLTPQGYQLMLQGQYSF
jgi:hypothetical protein